MVGADVRNMYFEMVDGFQGSKNQDEESGQTMRRYAASYPTLHESVVTGIDDNRVSPPFAVTNNKRDDY